MNTLLQSLVRDEEGATMVEYALMIGLVGAACVVVVSTLATALKGQFNSVATSVTGGGS